MAAALLVPADLCKTVLYAIVSPTVLGVATAPGPVEKSQLCSKCSRERGLGLSVPRVLFFVVLGVVEWKQELPGLCIAAELAPDKLFSDILKTNFIL